MDFECNDHIYVANTQYVYCHRKFLHKGKHKGRSYADAFPKRKTVPIIIRWRNR